MISWWRTSFGEEELESIRRAVLREHISQGPVTAMLEAEMCAALDVPYAVATTSGSMALLLSLLALGIKEGDEVLLPNRTFIATAHAVLLTGAKVVLVDTEKHLPLMDAAQIESKITPRTKAIMPVHLNGRATDMQAILGIAKRCGLYVIEDAAQAIFSKTTSGYLGTLGDFGCYSLGMTKLISSGQGGIITTRDKSLYDGLKLVRNHGVVDTLDAEYLMRSFNGKITDLQAAAGLVQLQKREEKIHNVIEIYRSYESALDKLPFLEWLPVNLNGGEVPLWVEVLCKHRSRVMDYLLENKIQSRKFLPNLHHSKHLGNSGEFPNSRRFEEEGLFLPCGPAQPIDNVRQVINCLSKFSE